jgi:hypothetical protein
MPGLRLDAAAPGPMLRLPASTLPRLEPTLRLLALTLLSALRTLSILGADAEWLSLIESGCGLLRRRASAPLWSLLAVVSPAAATPEV